MKAWQVVELGAPAEAVQICDVSHPVIGNTQTLVAMQAACLGFPDYLMAQGLYHEKPPLPFVFGGEGVGTIVEVGDRANGGSVGDRVIVVSGHAHSGHLAEFVAANPDQLLPLPQDMTTDHAAALFVAYQTAYVGLFRRAQLTEGSHCSYMGQVAESAPRRSSSASPPAPP